MSRFVVEYSFDPPLAHAEEGTMTRRLGAGLRTPTGEGQDCLIDGGRRRMLWSFEAADADALHGATDADSPHEGLRGSGVALVRWWTGSVYVPPPRLERAPSASSEELVDVVGEGTFGRPMALDELAALVHSCGWCSRTHRVQLARLVLAHDGRRALALFRAPDAESVRLAYRRVGLVDRVWSCRRIPLFPPAVFLEATR